MIKNIKKKCKIISDTFGLSTFLISHDQVVLQEYFKQQILNPLYLNEKNNQFNILQLDGRDFDIPVIRKTAFYEKYILMSIQQNNEIVGLLIIGPTITQPLSDDKINGLVNDARAFYKRESILNYYKTIPVIPSEQLMNTAILIHYFFHNRQLSIETLREYNASEYTDFKHSNDIQLIVSDNLQNLRYHERKFESEIIKIVKEGNLDGLKNPYFIKNEEEVSLFSKTSYLRSLKNHIITLITLISRAAIEGGLHAEISFGLNDRYIQKLEETNQINEVRAIAKEALYTYTEKVKQAKANKYSKTINLCIDFIYSNQYELISHDDIANHVELSPKYLSVLFKKEVGKTVTEFIQDTKIEEAKKLLEITNTPISEISTLLNYSDQSYFTKVFKKVAGTTPKKFREKKVNA